MGQRNREVLKPIFSGGAMATSLYRVAYDFEGEQQGELSVQAGDLVMTGQCGAAAHRKPSQRRLPSPSLSFFSLPLVVV